MPDRFAVLRNDFRQAVRLDRQTWLDLFRAAIELGFARVRLGSRQAGDLLGSADVAALQPAPALDQDGARLVERVAFAIPRAGPRLPWRADCLVQALAAQNWLGRHGVASQLVIGARKSSSAEFEAHAWLKVGERIVTGGDIGGYAPFGVQTPISQPTNAVPSDRPGPARRASRAAAGPSRQGTSRTRR